MLYREQGTKIGITAKAGGKAVKSKSWENALKATAMVASIATVFLRHEASAQDLRQQFKSESQAVSQCSVKNAQFSIAAGVSKKKPGSWGAFPILWDSNEYYYYVNKQGQIFLATEEGCSDAKGSLGRTLTTPPTQTCVKYYEGWNKSWNQNCTIESYKTQYAIEGSELVAYDQMIFNYKPQNVNRIVLGTLRPGYGVAAKAGNRSVNVRKPPTFSVAKPNTFPKSGIPMLNGLSGENLLAPQRSGSD